MRPVQRDLTTFACYFLLALLTLFLAMPGPLTPALMRDLGLGFTQASLHSVAQAAGMAVTGATGERFVQRFGRNGCVRLSLVLLSTGFVLLCSAVHPAMSLTGAFLMGCGGSLTLMAANAAMAERHSAHASIVFGEANVIAYLGIVAAPGIVSLMTAFAHWRWTVLVSLSAVLVFLAFFHRAEFGAPPARRRSVERRPLGFAYWCFWCLLMTSVAAEGTLLIWTAAYFERQLGWASELALLASMTFPAGVFVARATGVLLVRRFPVRRLVLPTIALSVAGFLLFRYGGAGALALAGLVIAGFGMGNLYPFGITLALAATEGDRDTATARVSLASAVSMITLPLIVGSIADRSDLATAFAAVPVCLALAAIATVVGLGRAR